MAVKVKKTLNFGLVFCVMLISFCPLKESAPLPAEPACTEMEKCWTETNFHLSEVVHETGLGDVKYALEKLEKYVVAITPLSYHVVGPYEDVEALLNLLPNATENTLQFYGYSIAQFDENAKTAFIIIEAQVGKSMNEMNILQQKGLRIMLEDDIRNIAKGLFQAIAHVGASGYYKPNINSSNIYIEQKSDQHLVAKIRDYRMGKLCGDIPLFLFNNGSTRHPFILPPYLPPEFFVRLDFMDTDAVKHMPKCKNIHQQRGDAWKLGLILWGLVIDKQNDPTFITPVFYDEAKRLYPYSTDTERMTEFYENMLQNFTTNIWLKSWLKKPSELINAQTRPFSFDFVEFIGKLLVFNPTTRMGPEEALKHAWFKGNIASKQKYTKESMAFELAGKYPMPQQYYTRFFRYFHELREAALSGAVKLQNDSEIRTMLLLFSALLLNKL